LRSACIKRNRGKYRHFGRQKPFKPTILIGLIAAASVFFLLFICAATNENPLDENQETYASIESENGGTEVAEEETEDGLTDVIEACEKCGSVHDSKMYEVINIQKFEDAARRLQGSSIELYQLTSESGGPGVFALCAVSIDAPPSRGYLYNIVQPANRNGSAAALAFALFNESVGARLSLDAFNEIFGFGDEGQPDALVGAHGTSVREALIQNAVYELENDEGRSYIGRIQEQYSKHFERIIEVIRHIVSTGSAMSSLVINYSPDSGNLTIGYSSDGPQPEHSFLLRLSWTGPATLSKEGRQIKSGDWVEPGVYSVSISDKYVAIDFTLESPLVFKNGSISGTMMQHVCPIGTKDIQALITGSADFSRLKITLKIPAVQPPPPPPPPEETSAPPPPPPPPEETTTPPKEPVEPRGGGPGVPVDIGVPPPPGAPGHPSDLEIPEPGVPTGPWLPQTGVPYYDTIIIVLTCLGVLLILIGAATRNRGMQKDKKRGSKHE